jgi:hypothetical protein
MGQNPKTPNPNPQSPIPKQSYLYAILYKL